MKASSGRTAIAAVDTAGLGLSYNKVSILSGIDLSLARSKTLALLGPSGCGKTTLLRLVAGLLAPDTGSITLDGRVVADAATGTFVPPEKRGLGMVFQDYALWPHLSVGRNVAFPLEMRGVGRAERDERVARALDRVGLAGFGGRNPGELSGGQQQRVAIARAIVGEPALVLFDEPLSNLDRELRETMVEELALLLSRLGLTAIYVTHDHSEAFTLADEVAVMRRGEIVQLASPEMLVDSPASPGIAEFLKLGAVAPLEYRDGAFWIAGAGVRLDADADAPPPANAAKVLLARGAVRLVGPGADAVPGRVMRSQFRGDGHLATVRVGNEISPLELQLLSDVRLEAGEHVGVRIEPRRLRWFTAD